MNVNKQEIEFHFILTHPQSVWKSEKRLTICSSHGRCGLERVLRN